jgi:hypothetical protein
MNILVVGFGNMGCRHAQSLLKREYDNIFVLEPNKEIIDINKSKIDDKENKIVFIDIIDDLTCEIDFAIIATSAYPRFEIVKKLLVYGIKKFLLEKVVFQSEKQFDIIIKMLKDYEAVAYCNFVNRYFLHFQALKNDLLNNLPFKIIINGGNFGLGCNALHYVDLFEFLCGEFSFIKSSNLAISNKVHKRGNLYKEVSGQLAWATPKGSMLLINSDENLTEGVIINVIQGGNINIFIEKSNEHIKLAADFSLKRNDYVIRPSSELTDIILNDIMDGVIILPNVQETKSCHIQYFAVLNQVFALSDSDLCPIT